jgi:hypothetical protein
MFFETPPLLLIVFAVPLGFDKPAANREFVRRVTGGSRTCDFEATE